MPEQKTTPSTEYPLTVETIGFAIGRLLRHTSLRSTRSLRNVTVDFITDAGINFATMTERDKEILFRNVGRGYATKQEKEQFF